MHGLLASQSCYILVHCWPVVSSLLNRHPYILLISLEIFFITLLLKIVFVTQHLQQLVYHAEVLVVEETVLLIPIPASTLIVKLLPGPIEENVCSTDST